MLVREWVKKMRERRARPPVISTKWGDVTEAARKRAALNMRDNPLLQLQVQEVLKKELGSAEQAVAEMRRRYPEIFQ